MTRRIKFEDWFKKQFGKLPIFYSQKEMRKLEKIVYAGYVADMKLKQNGDLKEKYNAALLAWRAKDEKAY